MLLTLQVMLSNINISGSVKSQKWKRESYMMRKFFVLSEKFDNFGVNHDKNQAFYESIGLGWKPSNFTTKKWEEGV